MGFFSKLLGKHEDDRADEGPGEAPGPATDAPANPRLTALVNEGQAQMRTHAESHHDAWGIGDAERWDLDESRGEIRFTFPDKVVTAPVQVLATYSRPSRSLVWAWANNTVADSLSRTSDQARQYGAEHQIPSLTAGQLPDLDEAQANAFVSAAYAATGATGFYRDAGADGIPYLVFGPEVTITPHDGQPSTYSAS